MIPLTRNSIFRNGGVTGPDNEFKRKSLFLVETNPDINSAVQCFLALLIVDIDALRDLVPFVQFKKREKHPWKSVIFSKFADCSL